ncbi:MULTISPECIES: carbonic anhydrase [unclassified Serratia (in: enterobacteria)]|uniref:carbonic anhydrase n=1 Tax=unclassified Serratia (in: enterobacteria) TaxID=2647522 RepID=UPI0004FFF4CC|nr:MULTISPECIES: carbonic anhydrase [unclassified Serratia (in: enterobacteria)]KFK92181.1 carbonic anhydrase [Serratia sp. Ag2]KFK97146.1 carbonic anhydrase [Serratia sp. Ag1]
MSKLPAKEPARRTLLKRTAALSALAITGIAGFTAPSVTYAAAMTREQRDKMTPDQIIESFKQGNMRFREGKMQQHDYVAQKQASQGGQYPAAVILSCIDSRAPAEILLDVGIGETFNARVAGNIQNDDILGSMEFACAVAGAKVVLVMGHTACGAVRGAIDKAELGNLTGLLNKIKPAVERTVFEGDRSGKNDAFVDAVAKTNVVMTIEEIRKNSPVLKKLEEEGKIKIVGSMYHLVGGKVDFLS